MNQTASALIGGVMLLVTTSCGGDVASTEESSPVAAPASAAASTTTTPGVVTPRTGGVPDATWRKVVTREQAVDLGIARAEYAEHLGADGRLPLVLRTDGATWSLSIVNDQGVTEIGDQGTLAYDDAGRLVMTSQSEGCPGCVSSLRWQVDGDVLRMSGMSGPDVVPLDRLIVEGTWSRSS